MSKTSHRIVWGLALSGLTAFPLLAQEPQAQQEPVATYEDVLFVEESLPYIPDSNTVATKIPVPLKETPASVGVVSAPMISEQGATVLGDALKNVSGVNVQTQSGVADYFVVRGFDSIANGLVMVDGASEPEISFYQLYNIERVEVLKGPGGFLYGANPIAATVNMVREQPEPSSFFELGLSGGSYGTYGGTVDWNASSTDGSFGFRLNGLWQESDGYRDDTPSDVKAVNPAFSWRLGENSLVNANFEFIDSSYSPDSGIPLVTTFTFQPPFPIPIPTGQAIADVPRTENYQSPFDRSEQETRRAQVDYENAISDRLTLRNKTYYRQLEWLSDGTILNGVLPGFLVGGPDQVIRTLVLLDDTQEFFGNQLEAVYSLETGSVKHQILGGLEIGRFDDEFTLDFGLLPTVSLENPIETAQGFQRIPNQAADAQTQVIAPYVVDQIRLSDRFQVLAGARFDAISYEDEVSGTDRDYSRLSPSLGIVYTPIESLSLYANAGQAFAPPSSRVVGDRKPEESTQYEVGAKGEAWGGKLQTTLALYELERENVAIPDLTGVTAQTGTQRSRGVELEIAAEPWQGLRTLFSYAYTDAELTRFSEIVQTGQTTFQVFDRSGNRPSFAPEHIANLWVSKRFGKLGLGAGGRYLSSQFIAEDNAFELDSTATLDASLSYDLSRFQLNLHLKNLTDEEYFTRGFGNTSVIPAPGFSVYGGLEFRLLR